VEKRLSGEAVLSPGAVDKNVVPRPQEEKTVKRDAMLLATLCCWSTTTPHRLVLAELNQFFIRRIANLLSFLFFILLLRWTKMDGSDDDEFNGFEEGEEEEEDFDFGDGDGDDDNDDEPLPSLSMADDDAISSKGSMRAYKIIAFEDIISSQQTKAEKIHEVLVRGSPPHLILL
jgi:hypothetical protein